MNLVGEHSVAAKKVIEIDPINDREREGFELTGNSTGILDSVEPCEGDVVAPVLFLLRNSQAHLPHVTHTKIKLVAQLFQERPGRDRIHCLQS